MNITFAPRGILQIDDATIIFKNFEGRGDKFNREGDRNFSLLIDDPKTADAMVKEGWNVRIKPARDENEDPFMRLPVKVKFSDHGPNVYLNSLGNVTKLDEESIGCLDNIEIESVSMDIRPYDWEVNGRTGRTAYLQSME
ncbi:MAG: hypothetical protein MR912_08615, partial [Prevotella sp.]|nr:hypothetical protein [Prevotella sp.]